MTPVIKAHCPVCKTTFQYPDCQYKPKTCSKFECVSKIYQNPARYISIIEEIDKDRQKAGI